MGRFVEYRRPLREDGITVNATPVTFGSNAQTLVDAIKQRSRDAGEILGRRVLSPGSNVEYDESLHTGAVVIDIPENPLSTGAIVTIYEPITSSRRGIFVNPATSKIEEFQQNLRSRISTVRPGLPFVFVRYTEQNGQVIPVTSMWIEYQEERDEVKETRPVLPRGRKPEDNFH